MNVFLTFIIMNNNIIETICVNFHQEVDINKSIKAMNIEIEEVDTDVDTTTTTRELLDDLVPTIAGFGTLNIVVKDTPINNTPIFILFTNDISGSMNETCPDGSTKMEHSIHTIRNILVLFAEQSENIDIWVQVIGFDDKIDTIIPAQKVSLENLDKLLNMLKKMRPRNGTNIELAIQNANKEMWKFREQHPDFIISHIFTTDGNANAGTCDINKLSSFVEPQFINTFIGFGYDHHAKMLNAMSNNKNGQYYFIDKIENGGLVFGEIIHMILYKALTDVNIKITNGAIYNYKTNTWDNHLEIDSLTGEANKVYHLCSSSPEDVVVEVVAINNIVDIENGTSTIYETACILGSTDLSKYLFRQKTQELLYESLKQDLKDNELLLEFKNRVNDFLSKLKKYMDMFTLTTDPFFIGIHDDLVIIINTIGTYYSEMFSISRANTNGRELSYNVSDIPHRWKRQNAGVFFSSNCNLSDDDELMKSLQTTKGLKSGFLRQQSQYHCHDDMTEEDSEQLTKLLRTEPLNCAYSTPRKVELMRSCSQPI